MDYKCISKLGLLAQLEGHQESVNCLQWNKSGRYMYNQLVTILIE